MKRVVVGEDVFHQRGTMVRPRNFLLLAIAAVTVRVAIGQCSASSSDQQFLGDGTCDSGTTLNTAGCNWDEGDCCRQTCASSASDTCPASGYPYDCQDPNYVNTAEDFALFDGGQCPHNSGYCTIEYYDMCQNAATLLGMSDTKAGNSVNNSKRVAGCYYYSGNLKFNVDLASTTNATAGSESILCIACDKVTTTTTTTTTTNTCGYSDCKAKPLWQCSLDQCTSVAEIRVASKQLTGTIPSSIGLALAGTLTGSFRLDSNQLSGTIPPSFGSLASLTTLYLMKNLLTGTIPASMCCVVTNLTSCWMSYKMSGSETNDFACPLPATCESYLGNTAGVSGCGVGAGANTALCDNTSGTGATITCPVREDNAVDCVGSWSLWSESPCSATCDGGTQARTFSVTTVESNGGNGCVASDGATSTRTCNYQSCTSSTPTTTTAFTRASSASPVVSTRTTVSTSTTTTTTTTTTTSATTTSTTTVPGTPVTTYSSGSSPQSTRPVTGVWAVTDASPIITTLSPIRTSTSTSNTANVSTPTSSSHAVTSLGTSPQPSSSGQTENRRTESPLFSNTTVSFLTTTSEAPPDCALAVTSCLQLFSESWTFDECNMWVNSTTELERRASYFDSLTTTINEQLGCSLDPVVACYTSDELFNVDSVSVTICGSITVILPVRPKAQADFSAVFSNDTDIVINNQTLRVRETAITTTTTTVTSSAPATTTTTENALVAALGGVTNTALVFTGSIIGLFLIIFGIAFAVIKLKAREEEPRAQKESLDDFLDDTTAAEKATGQDTTGPAAGEENSSGAGSAIRRTRSKQFSGGQISRFSDEDQPSRFSQRCPQSVRAAFQGIFPRSSTVPVDNRRGNDAGSEQDSVPRRRGSPQYPRLQPAGSAPPLYGIDVEPEADGTTSKADDDTETPQGKSNNMLFFSDRL